MTEFEGRHPHDWDQEATALPGRSDGWSADEAVLRVRAEAFEQMTAACAVIDSAGLITDTNWAWRLFAFLNDARRGTTDVGVDYLAVCDVGARAGAVGAAATGEGLRAIARGSQEKFDVAYACPSATEDRWFLLQAAAIEGPQGLGIVVTHTDITTQTLLRQTASTDVGWFGITEVTDEEVVLRLFVDQLSDSASSNEPFSAIVMRSAAYARCDSVYGHAVAADLAVKIGLRTSRVVGPGNTVCRTAAHEFWVSCPGLGHAEVRALAAAAKNVLDAPFQVGGLAIDAEIGVGHATAEPRVSVRELVRIARRAAMAGPPPT
ncbi:MAG: hypothetical protein JWM34_1636 [Ilumatobacteraceae bacterium]|nr:hypothetical protein [Ilumatobacteraceae bacterium]